MLLQSFQNKARFQRFCSFHLLATATIKFEKCMLHNLGNTSHRIQEIHVPESKKYVSQYQRNTFVNIREMCPAAFCSPSLGRRYRHVGLGMETFSHHRRCHNFALKTIISCISLASLKTSSLEISLVRISRFCSKFTRRCQKVLHTPIQGKCYLSVWFYLSLLWVLLH